MLNAIELGAEWPEGTTQARAAFLEKDSKKAGQQKSGAAPRLQGPAHFERTLPQMGGHTPPPYGELD